MSKISTSHPIVPVKVEDVTSTWISEILGEKISDEDFTVETNVQSGNGFLSNLIRIKCKSDSKSFSLIVKLLPRDDYVRKLVISDNYDKNEIKFYQEIAPDLVKICPDIERYLCHSHYGRIQEADPSLGLDYASVIVLEDLKPEGYYTINFAGELRTENVEEVITFLAKLHYGSMVLEERKGTRLDESYGVSPGNDDEKLTVFFEMAKNGLVVIDTVFAEYGADEEVREAMRSLIPSSDIIIKSVQDNVKHHRCLIHGDLWPNNLLINDNANLSTKVIDWQLLAYQDPTGDLAVSVLSNLPVDKLTKENVEELLELYHNVLIQQLQSESLSEVMRRDWEAFSETFYTWGMAYTFTWFLTDTVPFAANFPRLVKILEFLVKEMNVVEFLLNQIKN